MIGAAGGIGQPLSLLLALNLPAGSELSLFDMRGATGVAADIGHIDRDIKIHFADGNAALPTLAKGVDVFVIVAGVPRKPGMTRDDLFTVNASIVFDVVNTCAKVSPKACFAIVTNPVNSTVPIAAQVLKKLGVYDKNKLFGVSTLDVVRATRFINDERAPLKLTTPVPVVGGHSDVTIVPLLSQLGVGKAIDVQRLKALTTRIQDAGTEVVKAKGNGSATLSMAYAGARFALAIVEGLTGAGTPTVYTYVDTTGGEADTTDSPFLAIPVILGKNGIQQRLSIGKIDEREKELLSVAKKTLKGNISKGEQFARSKL